MKRNLCDVALMLSRYFLIGFLIQLIAFNTLFAKSGETPLHKATYKNINNLSVKHGFDILKKDKTKNDHTIGSPYNNGKKGISFAPVKKNIDKPTNGSMERSARVAVSGVVSDENGNPLIGVSVKIKGTTQGTATDANGHFQLEAANDATLVFSYIGYENQEVAVNGQTTINVTMHTSATGLNEVVVVGYGTQKKSDLTGAVSSVSSKELQKRPAINIEEMLEGKAAGVKVSTNSGQPGGNTSVRIRGYGSINASNAPLYVVDGIVWTEGIGLLNPNDIQDIEVLKDASATAIYGTRGSNGVILVTTKRGKKGGQVSYNGYVSVGMMARKLPVMNSEQFLKTQDIAYQNIQKFDPAGWASGKYKDKDPKIQRTALIGKLFDEDLNPLYDVDYQDAATRHAISHSQNL
ncbi:MAG TPA: carboxypeptidase-like regulatory domain-containing protein, partial [Chitinophagaceae bacterium]|nr:carboxypeptidase-like regulatory domain-containing protein [Chitinophagaceae bacterium]